VLDTAGKENMDIPTITDHEFNQFRKLIYNIAGINMSPIKKPLVMGRLGKRLNHHGLQSYGEYFKLLNSNGQDEELQMAVDLLTTNETYFFREPKHFDFLQRHILSSHPRAKTFRVWSAACSSGQEPYSIAMILANFLGENPWEIIASDISIRVLDRARHGHYPLEQTQHIPKKFLAKYCLKGIGPQEGTFIIDRNIRNRIKFSQINLNDPFPLKEKIDLIFLRNVMIYFNAETKRKVIDRMAEVLKPGGYLFIGHSESLNGIYDEFETVAPAIYRKK
jgi:chemotaxis protein methyltransferase CheR